MLPIFFTLLQAASFTQQDCSLFHALLEATRFAQKEPFLKFAADLKSAGSMLDTPFFTRLVPEWNRFLHEKASLGYYGPLNEEEFGSDVAYLSQPAKHMPEAYQENRAILTSKIAATLLWAKEHRPEWRASLLEYARAQANIHRDMINNPLLDFLVKANSKYRQLLVDLDKTPLVHPMDEEITSNAQHAVQLFGYVEAGMELAGQSEDRVAMLSDGLEQASIIDLVLSQNPDLRMPIPVGEMRTLFFKGNIVSVIHAEDGHGYGLMHMAKSSMAFSCPSAALEQPIQELLNNPQSMITGKVELKWNDGFNNVLVDYLAGWPIEDWLWLGALWKYALRGVGGPDQEKWFELINRLQPTSIPKLMKALQALPQTTLITEMLHELSKRN